MSPLHEKSSVRSEEGKAGTRDRDAHPKGERAFAQQEAALTRMGAQLRAANAKIDGIKQRLQAQISAKKR